MTTKKVKNAPLNVLVGYLTQCSEGYDCGCPCKWETWTESFDNVASQKYAEKETYKCKREGKYDTCLERIAYERVMEAVQKQMPKKVIRHHEKYQRRYNDTFTCPTCGESALTNCGDHFCDYGLDFCEHCGQAIDWGDKRV